MKITGTFVIATWASEAGSEVLVEPLAKFPRNCFSTLSGRKKASQEIGSCVVFYRVQKLHFEVLSESLTV